MMKYHYTITISGYSHNLEEINDIYEGLKYELYYDGMKIGLPQIQKLEDR